MPLEVFRDVGNWVATDIHKAEVATWHPSEVHMHLDTERNLHWEGASNLGMVLQLLQQQVALDEPNQLALNPFFLLPLR
jgi:hypothetical protein